MNGAPIRKELLEILACPACSTRPRVTLRDDSIYCAQCGRIYPIENGVPVMLIDRATVCKPEGESQ